MAAADIHSLDLDFDEEDSDEEPEEQTSSEDASSEDDVVDSEDASKYATRGTRYVRFSDVYCLFFFLFPFFVPKFLTITISFNLSNIREILPASSLPSIPHHPVN